MNKENKENLIPVKGLSPFKRFCMTIGELPTSYLETMTYYEMLVWFTKYMQDTVIPTINNNASAVDELQNKYIEFTDNLLDRQTTFENNLTTRQENYEEEVMTLFNNLQDFVNNYFNNLDVQEEINNKLDEMAESGQLADIIAQYLGLAGMLTFNTVADMKNATNLVNGSTCQTLGFYNINDGGKCIYKIREISNQDIVDNITIISLTNSNILVAEIISNKEMSLLQFGAKADNSTNNTNNLQIAINYCINNQIKLFIPSGIYLTNSLSCNNYIEIVGNDATLKAISNIDYILYSSSKLIIKNIIFDGDSKSNYGLKLDGFNININNCYFKNTIKESFYALGKINIYDYGFINNCTFDTAGGGIIVQGYPYENSNDYKGSIIFNNCKTINDCGTDENLRLYMFRKLDYVEINGGDFTGNSQNATNIYECNHVTIKGGYYHDISRGVTTGQITKNIIISDVMVQNINNGGGIHIDAVTNDRIYPEVNTVITNNIIINAYRGMYLQGKKMHIVNNSITCGINTATNGGIVRINADDNENNSHIFIDKLYIYNSGHTITPIVSNNAIITLGNDIFIDQKNYNDITSNKKSLKYGVVEINDSYYASPVDETIIVDATNNLVQVFLPKEGDTFIVGKHYRIVRIDSSTYNVNLRVRSNGGTINGINTPITLTNKISDVIQIGAGIYILNQTTN